MEAAANQDMYVKLDNNSKKTVRNSLSCSNVAGTSMDHGAS